MFSPHQPFIFLGTCHSTDTDFLWWLQAWPHKLCWMSIWLFSVLILHEPATMGAMQWAGLGCRLRVGFPVWAGSRDGAKWSGCMTAMLWVNFFWEASLVQIVELDHLPQNPLWASVKNVDSWAPLQPSWPESREWLISLPVLLFLQFPRGIPFKWKGRRMALINLCRLQSLTGLGLSQRMWIFYGKTKQNKTTKVGGCLII